MSVENARQSDDAQETRGSREIIPGQLREAVFVVGTVLGMAVFSVGYIQLILGMTLGLQEGEVLSEFVQTTGTIAGLGIIVRFFVVRVKALENYVEQDQPVPRLIESAVMTPIFAGLLFGFGAIVATIKGALITVSGPAAPVVYGLYAAVLVALVNLTVEALRIAGFRAIDALYDGLESVGVTQLRLTKALPLVFRDAPTGAAVLTALTRILLGGSTERTKTNTGTLGLMLGGFMLMLGVAAQKTFSAPFLQSLGDKLFLLGFGLACVWLGWKMVRLSARVVGW